MPNSNGHSNGNGESNGNGKPHGNTGNDHANKYRDDYPNIAAAILRKGGILEDLAEAFKVKLPTLSNWREQHPEFDTACKENKADTDGKVEKSLLQRALGYEYEEVESTVFTTKTGETIGRIKKTKRQIPPDVTAQIFWLKNRRYDLWRDVNRHEITGKEGNPILIEALQKLSPDQLKQVMTWIAEPPQPEQSAETASRQP